MFFLCFIWCLVFLSSVCFSLFDFRDGFYLFWAGVMAIAVAPGIWCSWRKCRLNKVVPVLYKREVIICDYCGEKVVPPTRWLRCNGIGQEADKTMCSKCYLYPGEE
jgi:hypothetical protein